MFRPSRHRVAALLRAADCSCEPLEGRVLLSTISWTNEGADNFGVFAPNTTLARSIVHRAIDFWEKVIVNFNLAAPFGNVFNLSVTAAGGGIASGSPTAFDADDVPRSGSISVGTNPATHFFDPSADDAEFTNFITPSRANSTQFTSFDFYTTMLHEIGHAVGVSYGFGSAIDPFVTDTGIDDPTDPNPGNLFAFNIGGGAIEATFTNADASHLWEGPATAATIGAGLPVHANDLMNPGRALPGPDRFLITNTDATLLQQAYGYSVAMPSQIDTFHAVLNVTTDQVIVRGGAGATNDTIELEVAGGNLVVRVNGTHESIPLTEVSSLSVNSGDGNDTIFLDSIDSGTSVIISSGAGNDTIHLANLGQNMDVIDAPVVFDGGSGTDELMFWDSAATFSDTYTITSSSFTRTALPVMSFSTTVELLTLFAESGNNTFNINSTGIGTDWLIHAGNGNDTLNYGNNSIAGIAGVVEFVGQGNTDTINILDSLPTSQTTYEITNFDVARSSGPELVYSTVESLLLNATSGNNTINLNTGPGNIGITVNAGAGADTVNINPSAYTGPATNGDIFINGSTDAGDTINFNDQANSSTTTAVVLNNNLNRTNSPDYNYSNFESLVYNGGSGNETFLIVSMLAATPVALHGNGGGDVFAVGNALFGSSLNQVLGAVSVFGESGTDALQVWDTSNALANSFTVGFDTVDGATSAPTTYASVESVTINAGSGNDTFTVSGTAGTPVNISGNDGADSFNVNQTGAFNSLTLNGGNAGDVLSVGAGNLGQVQGTVAFDGGAASDAITLNDNSVSIALTHTITSTTYNRTQLFGGLTYGTTETMTLNAGSGADTVNLTSSAIGSTWTINAGDGNDTLNLGAGNLDNTKGAVTFNGQGATDNVFVHDGTTAFSDAYTITPTTLTRPAGGFASLAYGTCESLTLNAQGGNNTITVSSTAASTPASINAGLGSDFVNVVETNPAAPVIILPSAGDDTVQVNSDGVGSANVRFDATQRVGALSISAGGTATVSAGGNKVLTCTSLSTIGTGRVDLTDNDLIVDYSGASPLATIQSRINAARNGGAWNGSGITSSAAATNPADNTTLGAMEATDYTAATGLATFNGQPIDSTAVLVKYTYYGDADFSGSVDFDDYVRADSGLNFGLAGWVNGDFDGSGGVDFDDTVLLDLGLNSQGPPL